MNVEVCVNLNNEAVEKAYKAVEIAKRNYQDAIVKLNWELEHAKCIEIKKVD